MVLCLRARRTRLPDTPQGVLAELKTFVHDQLGIENMTAAEIAETERRLERAKRRRGL